MHFQNLCELGQIQFYLFQSIGFECTLFFFWQTKGKRYIFLPKITLTHTNICQGKNSKNLCLAVYSGILMNIKFEKNGKWIWNKSHLRFLDLNSTYNPHFSETVTILSVSLCKTTSIIIYIYENQVAPVYAESSNSLFSLHTILQLSLWKSLLRNSLSSFF